MHFIAALRMAARAAGFGEVTVAAAASRGVAPDLPHPDTLLGTLWFESGARLGGGGARPGQAVSACCIVHYWDCGMGSLCEACGLQRCLSVCRRHRQLHNDLL